MRTVEYMDDDHPDLVAINAETARRKEFFESAEGKRFIKKYKEEAGEWDEQGSCAKFGHWYKQGHSDCWFCNLTRPGHRNETESML